MATTKASAKKGLQSHKLKSAGLAAKVLDATALSQLVNAYRIGTGALKTIVVPNASQLSTLQDVTVTGTLLKKQLVRLTSPNKRQIGLAANNGAYTLEGDGDIHFDLGVKQLQPHVPCELQNAKAWLSTFQSSVGASLTVSGFFRCLFEHPGFLPGDDAHIFEIHPVRAVSINGKMQAFDVDIPDQPSIHTWTSPHPLNQQDDRIKVHYDKAKDTLTFTDMDGQDENYVAVSGNVSAVNLKPTSNDPATFTFTSPDIGKPLQALCLKGTRAAKQLAALRSKTSANMIVLRNIDLSRALKNEYVINLLVIDLQA
jgi:hypothetical protein